MKNNLKFCREELEMTQTELGYVFGVHKSTISGWETGNDNIPLKKLIKFCNLYNYSVDYALGLSRKNLPSSSTEPDKVKIGLKLREIRQSLNYTQTQMADECGIGRSTYTDYELGVYLVSTITLYTICKNHNISIDYILNRTKQKEVVSI